MVIRGIPFVAFLAAGCVTGGGERSLSSEKLSAGRSVPAGNRIDALFLRAPWSTITDSTGGVVYTQERARLRFLPHAGGLERTKIHIYDETRNDVGFHYGGAFVQSEPKCLYALSVYVYPATEPLGRHLKAVVAEITRANPDARETERTINLDRDHGGTGVHAGYLNDINGLESFEGVSIFERGGWFIKYRTTIGPAENPACEQRIRAAIAGMQVRER
jgi:hypothetical protein